MAKKKSLKRNDLPDFVEFEKEKRMMMEVIQQKLANGEFESDDEVNEFLAGLKGKKMAAILAENRPVTATRRDRALEHLSRISNSMPYQQKRKIAKTATGIDRDCVEAWLALSKTFVSFKLAEKYLREAVAAGRRAHAELIADAREQDEPWLWGHVEARAFLEACHELAIELEIAARDGEAIDFYREILELNAADNQGVRHDLFRCLLSVADNPGLRELREAYPDEQSAPWLYLVALHEFLGALEASSWNPEPAATDDDADASWDAFRQMPAEFDAANSALDAAFAANRFAPLLLGDPRAQQLQISYFRLGSPHEAIECCRKSGLLWAITPAMAWLYARLNNSMGIESVADIFDGVDDDFIADMKEIHAELAEIDPEFEIGADEFSELSRLAGAIREEALAKYLEA